LISKALRKYPDPRVDATGGKTTELPPPIPRREEQLAKRTSGLLNARGRYPVRVAPITSTADDHRPSGNVCGSAVSERNRTT
jgi:hypothetical protein